MAPRLKVSTEAVLSSYKDMIWPDLEENLRLMAGLEAPLLKTATQLASKMLQTHLLQREVVLTDFIEPSVLKNIRGAVSTASLE